MTGDIRHGDFVRRDDNNLSPGSIINSKEMYRNNFRDERIDSVKYWLIVLVIAGHVFGKFLTVPECNVIRMYIYMFHMPLFIFISGYFTRKKKGKQFTSAIWKLLEPLILFHTIAIISQLIYTGSISLSDILTPWWVLWYLLSLIYWRLLIYVIPDNILKNTKMILICTFCISILAGFLPFNRFLSIQRTLSFMPFFFLGYCLKGKNLYLSDRYKVLCFMFLLIMLIVPLFFPQYLGSLKHADPYVDFYGALKRIFVFCLALPMSLAFINVCPNNTWIARQGRLTMQYYILHALVIPPLVVIVNKYLPTTLFVAVILSITIIIGLGVASYFPYFTMFTNPSSIRKKK